MDVTQLGELGRVLRVLGEHGESLSRDTPREKFDEVLADLSRAQKLIEKVAGPKPLTNCKRHPFGAVDVEAPDRCLICHTHRRRAQITRA